MLFITTRIAFYGLALMIGILVTRKWHAVKRRKWIMGILALAVVFSVVLTLNPVEKYFVTFSSPQSAYYYNHLGSVELIVEGEKTCFVVGRNGNTYVCEIIPKEGDRWKLGTGIDTKMVTNIFSDGIVVHIYQYKNTGEYYISAQDTTGGPSTIYDSLDSDFQYVQESKSMINKTYYIYYAYIGGLDSQYFLTVNGKNILVRV